MYIDNSLSISIGTVIRNPEMLKFVSGHFKAKKISKHAVEKIPYLSRYVSDQYKTQLICHKAILGSC